MFPASVQERAGIPLTWSRDASSQPLEINAFCQSFRVNPALVTVDAVIDSVSSSVVSQAMVLFFSSGRSASAFRPDPPGRLFL